MQKPGKKNTVSRTFSHDQMATHAYQVLNMIIGDLLSAAFLDASIEAYENSKGKMSEPTLAVVHFNRNRLRLAASALYRYTEIFKKRIKKLNVNLPRAEKLNQKLNCHQFRDFRHLFEHELSLHTQEPHSPEQVEGHFKNISPLFNGEFKKACYQLAQEILDIRDGIATNYPNCGKGVERWKIDSPPPH